MVNRPILFRRLVWRLFLLPLLGLWVTNANANEAPLQLVAASIDSDVLTAELPCRKLYMLIAQEALRRANIDFVCEPLPWKRAQVMVEQGERDAMVTTRTDERSRYSVASAEMIYQVKLHAFINANHPLRAQLSRLHTPAQLRSWRVLSYLGDGWAQTHLENNGVTIDWSRDMATVLNKLVAQRGDISISDEALAMPLIQAMKLQDSIIMLPRVFNVANVHFMLSKKSPYIDKMPIINASLKAMHQDGSSARITRESLAQSRQP